jgi:hypothetical protein
MSNVLEPDTSSRRFLMQRSAARPSIRATAPTAPRNRYWDFGAYIWNNDGDTAKLKKLGGTVVDTCSCSGAGDSVNC